jgi:thymidylate kinase
MTQPVGVDPAVEQLPPGLVRDLFATLERAGIRYVLLRGYLPASEITTALDIDVYIPRADHARAARVLTRSGWRVRRAQTGRYPHRFYDHVDDPTRLCVMLDVVDALCYGPARHELRQPELVLTASERVAGVWVPHPWIALFTFALHVLLDKEHLSDANAARGRALWKVCLERAAEASIVADAYGDAAALLTAAFGDWVREPAVGGFAALQRRARALSCLRPRPVLALFDAMVKRWRWRRARPLRFAIVGMDGSGKSTLIESVRSLGSPLPIGTAYLGHNQYRTRLFREILERLDQAKRAAPNGLAVRLWDKARALAWPLELYARMRAAEWGRALVFYDRYPFPDFERDDMPTTLPGHVMHLYERLWTWALPHPDVLWLCDGDPRLLWSRKQEYSFAVFERGRQRYHDLLERFPGEREVVRTDGSLVELVASLPALIRRPRGFLRLLYE